MTDIQKHIDAINSFLEEGFEQDVFAAVIENMHALDNQLRVNNFAYGARELISIALERIAPNDDVVKCSWFIEDQGVRPGCATRRQKIQYAIYGGLAEKYVEKLYDVDIDNVIKCVTRQYEQLSQYTHIRRNTFGIADTENIIALEALSSLSNFVINIAGAKESFSDQVAMSLQNILYTEISDNHIDDFAHLAWHTRVDDVHIDEVDIDNIDYDSVYCTVYGSASIERSCARESGETEEDTYLGSTSCPFSVEATCSVQDLKDVKLEELDMETRQSSHF